MGRILFLIGIGGFAGSILRHLTVSACSRLFSSAFPSGTFIVNISGCLAIGIVAELSQRYDWISEEWRLMLMTGLLGGYTTFSAFSLENLKLLQNSEYLTFAIYSVSSFCFGLLAAFTGMMLVKYLG